MPKLDSHEQKTQQTELKIGKSKISKIKTVKNFWK